MLILKITFLFPHLDEGNAFTTVCTPRIAQRSALIMVWITTNCSGTELDHSNQDNDDRNTREFRHIDYGTKKGLLVMMKDKVDEN